MRSGSPLLFEIALFDSTGAGLTYADKTAFTTAGWTLDFIDMSTGLAVSPTIAYTLEPIAGIDGRHMVGGITLTTAAWFVRITPPTTAESFIIMPSVTWTGEQYDTDSLYTRINSVYGLSSSTSVPSVTLNSVIEGDSYSTTFTVPTSYLARMGWTDLSGTVLDGTIRSPSDDGTGTPRATLTEGSDPKLTHNATLTAFDISWSTYPTGMILTSPERATGSVNMRVEVQAKKAGKVLTILYNAPLPVYRQDDSA